MNEAVSSQRPIEFAGSDQSRAEESWIALVYVLGVICLGIPLALYGLAVTAAVNSIGWLVLAGLTLLTAFVATRIPIPGNGSGSLTVTPADCFVFVAIVLLGPAPAAALACLEGFADSFWAKVGSHKKFLFNMGALSLSGYLAGTGFYWVQSRSAPFDLAGLDVLRFLASAAFAALIYFLANTMIVTAALALTRRTRIFSLWKKHSMRLAPASFLNMAVALLVVLLFLRPFDGWAALAVVPILVFGYWSQRISERGVEASSASEPVLSLRASRLVFGEEISPKARRFVQLMVLLSVPIVLYSVAQAGLASNRSSLILLLLAAVTSWFPFKISFFQGRMWITMTDIFVFAAMIQFGPEMAVFVAVVEGLVFNIKNRPKFAYQWIFNISQIGITAFLVGHALRGMGTAAAGFLFDDVQHSLALLVAALCCGLLYYLVNSSIVSAAMAAAGKRSFREVWLTTVGWSSLTLSGALIGVFLVLLVV